MKMTAILNATNWNSNVKPQANVSILLGSVMEIKIVVMAQMKMTVVSTGGYSTVCIAISH